MSPIVMLLGKKIGMNFKAKIVEDDEPTEENEGIS